MLKKNGLGKLSENLNALSKALQSLETINFKFDPNDPISIDAAVQDMEAQVDAQVEPWAGTPLVKNLAAQVKEHLAGKIFERAAELRLKKEVEDEK